MEGLLLTRMASYCLLPSNTSRVNIKLALCVESLLSSLTLQDVVDLSMFHVILENSWRLWNVLVSEILFLVCCLATLK